MNLSAVFETWHLGDGNYPPLLKGMLVNLSFELEADEIVVSEGEKLAALQHLGEANYKFLGKVLRVYGESEPLQRLVVVDCSDFRFYLTGCALPCRVGSYVEGRGTLLLDHYLWVEFLHQYPDPPDLFYDLRVERIWKNKIPDRYIYRTPNAMSHPTRLHHAENQPMEVQSIESDSSVSYYVVEFSNENLDPAIAVPRTFLV